MPDIRPILDPVPVDRAIKRQAWDAFYGSNSETEFRSHFDNMPLPRETKRALWDAKFAQDSSGSAPAAPPKEGILDRAKQDLSIGFRGSLSDVQHTGANILSKVAPGTAASLEQKSKANAPRPEEMAGHQGFSDTVLQGVGALPISAAKYAPAMASRRFAPLVAGAIDAAGEADKGIIPALKAGAKGAAGFSLQNKAAGLPTRLQRTVGSAAAMGVPAMIESGGDVRKTGAAMVLGGAMGAVPGKAHGKEPAFVKTAQEAGRELVDNFKALVVPTSRDATAAKTGRIARARYGELARKSDVVEHALRETRKTFDSQTPDSGLMDLSKEGFDFVDKSESGDYAGIANPAHRPIAQAIHDGFEERYQELSKRKLLSAYVENYFPHMFTTPERARQMYQILGKSPMMGPGSFKKGRVFGSIKEAIDVANRKPELGLKLVSNNPIDLVLLKMREMDKMIAAHDILEEMNGAGMRKFVKLGDEPPPGWAKIDDRVSDVRSRDPKTGQIVVRGSYYVPEPAAVVINNHLSPGFRNNTAFRGVNLAANVMNQFQLGWSAFHLGFTTYDAMTSNFALGLEKIVHGATKGSTQHVVSGLKDMATAPWVAVEPIRGLAPGGKATLTNKFIEEWMKPGTHPSVAPLVELAQQAGARVQLDPFYKTQIWRNMQRAWKAGEWWSAGMRVPFALTEMMAQPIMETIVPQQKLGAFARLAEFEMSRLPAGATQDDVRRVMQKAWDSVDNRLGQLVYDNLFWRKSIKDLAMITTRAPGWSLGTVRELGGAAIDWATVFKRAKAGDTVLTHKMAYSLALPMVMGTIGGISNKLMTGENPQTPEDYFFPRTGGFHDDGTPKRVSFPSYVKDVYSYAHDPLKTVAGKMHPMLTAISEMVRNKDWRNEKIFEQQDAPTKQAYDLFAHALKQFVPYAWRYAGDQLASWKNDLPSQYSAGESVAALFGHTPAPADVGRSDAELYLRRQRSAMFGGAAKSHATQARIDERGQIERAIRLGKDPQPLIDRGISSGQITDRDVDTARKRARTSPLVGMLEAAPFDQALEAYELALPDTSHITPEEMSEMKKIVQEKVYKQMEKLSARPEDDPGRIKTESRIQKAGLMTRAGTPPPPIGRIQ